MLTFSPHAGGLAESQTLAISATAKRMKAEGINVAPFSAGEPDFDTPAPIQEAAHQAIRDGCTRYGPAAGIAPLREAVARHLSGLGLEGLTADATIVSAGAKAVLYFGLSVVLRPGDEVIVPTPCWLSYPKMIQALGATMVPVPTNGDSGFAVDPDQVRAAITPRTRVMMINSPGNPTGAVQPTEVMAELGRIAVEHDIAVISDEIYEHLTYLPATFTSFAAAAPHAREHSLIVNGVSKAYAMTGWRIGYAGGPSDWIKRMIRLQSHALSGPPEICQRAALAGLTGPLEPVLEMRAAFKRRRDVMVAALVDDAGLSVPVPDGAFYLLPSIAGHLGKRHGDTVMDSAQTLAAALLEHAHVAAVPGEVFEAPGTIRLSYACSEADIRAGVRRLGAFLASLK
jgi:aspartate/methionine/tyrosine aminotransferase